MLLYWGIDNIEHLFGSLLFGMCIYVFGCELIVRDPMLFNNWNLFSFSKEEKERKTRKKIHVEKHWEKARKNEKKKTRKKASDWHWTYK